MKKIRAVVILLFVAVLAACSKEPTGPEEPVTLNVLAWNEKIFNERYGDFFIATHPNYDIHVISVAGNLKPGEDLNLAVNNLINDENPDLIVLPMEFHAVLKENGQLVSLMDRIKGDDFNLSEFTPAVMNSLQDAEGQIYGLTPTFIGSALYYNKKLFEANNVPLPTDSMTWSQVFELAQRFPNTLDNETRQYGLYRPDSDSSYPFMMALRIGEGSGLSFYSNNKFTFSSKSWEEIFQNVADCFQTEVCFDKSQMEAAPTSDRNEVERRSYPFLAGNIAMAVENSSLYRFLVANRERYKELDWDVVSMPVSAEQPDTGNGINMSEIFSISKNSDQAEAAWDLIRYVCGEEYARILPRVNPDDLPARPAAHELDEKMGVFYKLKYTNNTLTHKLRELPKPVIVKMDELSQRYFPELISENITVAEALKMIEQELQTVLDENL